MYVLIFLYLLREKTSLCISATVFFFFFATEDNAALDNGAHRRRRNGRGKKNVARQRDIVGVCDYVPIELARYVAIDPHRG